MLAFVGIIAFFGIALWMVISVNREAYEGVGLLGWLIIALIIAPLYGWLLENGLVIEFSIVFLVLLFGWFFKGLSED